MPWFLVRFYLRNHGNNDNVLPHYETENGNRATRHYDIGYPGLTNNVYLHYTDSEWR